MRIYAIGDLHLPGGQDKPMAVFGEHWESHFERISSDWAAKVEEDDIVLLPGDISWAMTLEQAMDDLRAIGALPGRKIMLRGNHDYWWNSIGRIRAALPENFFAIQNDAARVDGLTVAGTRGWQTPGSRDFQQQDEKIYQREVQRLELSLREARRKAQGGSILGMIHYPPFNERREDNGFTALFAEYGVKTVLYGHLHGKSIASAFQGEREGIQYRLVSCDALDFRLSEVNVDI
jgi:predicted phosphohydrolase